MVISLLVDQVLKMTPEPIDWILHPLQQPMRCALLWPLISNQQLGRVTNHEDQ